MPLNLERNDSTHRAVVQLYQLVEDSLLRRMGESVERLIEAPDWERMVTLEIMRLRREAMKAAGMIDSVLPRLTEKALEEALMIGATDAYAGIKAVLGEEAAATASLSSAVNHAGMYALAGEMQGDLAKLRHSVLRAADDMYRRTVQVAAAKTVTGAQAIGGAWRDAARQMAREGLTGFVDDKGRKWKLDTYAEMATRTATNRAHMLGHSQAMIDHGLDLIVVSSHRNPAPQCAPFEGKVLSLTGKHSGRSKMDNLVDGTTAIVNVKCSLDEAIAKGFRHVGCRHTWSAYVPGAKLPTPEPDPDHEGYKATQKQRYYERKIREWRRAEAVAVDKQYKDEARAKIRHYRQLAQQNADDNGLRRKKERETLC